MKAVLLGACCAAVIACSAAKRSPSATMPGTASGAEPARGDRHGEIAQLDGAIRQDLARLGLPEPTPAPMPTTQEPGMSPQAMAAKIAPPSTDNACTHGTSETCSDSCKLADSICENAGKICTIAGELDGADAWANGKCTEGKTSCDKAKERCCGCQL